MTDDDRLLTALELTELLACSGPTIRRMVESGDLPAPIDSGRRERQWRRADLDPWLGPDEGADTPLLTAEQVAERLDLTSARVYQVGREEKLPVVRLGSRTMRFRETDVRALMGEEASPTPEPEPETAPPAAPEPQPAVSAGAGELHIVVLHHPREERWYPVVVVKQGFETDAAAVEALVAATARLAGPRWNGSEAQPDLPPAAPPVEATPGPQPDPAGAPQPDIGTGFAQNAEQWPSRPTGPTPEEPGAEMEGMIKYFAADKGYGFIEPDDRSRDIFLHISELDPADPLREFFTGERVRFQVNLTERGRQAVSVTRVTGR